MLLEIAGLPIHELADEPWTPLPPIGLNAPPIVIFSDIQAGDGSSGRFSVCPGIPGQQKPRMIYVLIGTGNYFERNLGMVARDGIEPPTRGFSVRCSTS